MRIGELSKLTGCKVVTIRYYESQDLLPEPGRSASNYRNYADEDVQRLNFIRNCRLLGIGIPEIRKMIDYKRGAHKRRQLDKGNSTEAHKRR